MSDLPNIAFIGKAGSGKDTCAELLAEHADYCRVAFADALKDVAAQLWGEDARTNRDYLQKLGVAVREIDPDTWVNVALRKLNDGRTAPTCITDCRFRNEAWALKGEGFTIVRVLADRGARLDRLAKNGKLGPEGWEQHVSETDLDDWPEDYTVRNLGSKAELLDELVKVIKLELVSR